jgi:putative redox protein
VNISMEWQGGLKFTGTSRFGHQISTDGSKKAGGNEDGYQPVELLLFGLAGCSGIDVVSIGAKMKQDITSLTINIKAEQKEEHPRFISKAHIEYNFTGKGLKMEMLERAVQLSEEKYCTVGTTLSGITKITHTVNIEEG